MGEKNKISVVLSPEEFQRFESYCTEKGFKKSTLIVRLIRDHLDREGHHPQPSLPFPSPSPIRSRRRTTRSKGT